MVSEIVDPFSLLTVLYLSKDFSKVHRTAKIKYGHHFPIRRAFSHASQPPYFQSTSSMTTSGKVHAESSQITADIMRLHVAHLRPTSSIDDHSTGLPESPKPLLFIISLRISSDQIQITQTVTWGSTSPGFTHFTRLGENSVEFSYHLWSS